MVTFIIFTGLFWLYCVTIHLSDTIHEQCIKLDSDYDESEYLIYIPLFNIFIYSIYWLICISYKEKTI